MIDDPQQVLELLADLNASLPIAASLTPELHRVARERSGGDDVAVACRVIAVHYAGDPGGILCRLAFDRPVGEGEFVVSITHLVFRGGSPLTRDILAYQKHRTKRIRRGMNAVP